MRILLAVSLLFNLVLAGCLNSVIHTCYELDAVGGKAQIERAIAEELAIQRKAAVEMDRDQWAIVNGPRPTISPYARLQRPGSPIKPCDCGTRLR